MSLRRVFHYSGAAGILCAVFLPLSWILHYTVGSSAETWIDVLSFVGEVCLIFALYGIYGTQVEESGKVGFIGFLLVIIATSTALSLNWLPEVDETPTLDMVLLAIMAIGGLVGYLLLGIGSWRANKFPQWAALAWPAGWAISIVSVMLVNGDMAGADGTTPSPKSSRAAVISRARKVADPILTGVSPAYPLIPFGLSVMRLTSDGTIRKPRAACTIAAPA